MFPADPQVGAVASKCVRGKRITFNIVAGDRRCCDGVSIGNNRAPAIVVYGCSDCVCVCKPAGRGDVTCRHRFTEELEGKFRIIYKHVPNTCNGLRDVVSPHHPAVTSCSQFTNCGLFLLLIHVKNLLEKIVFYVKMC